MPTIDLFTAGLYRGVKRVLCCGSRSVDRRSVVSIRDELLCLPSGTIVVHGGHGRLNSDGVVVSGADLLCAEVALDLGLGVEEHRGGWPAGVDYVIAWWDGESLSTVDILWSARLASVPVRVLTVSKF